MTVMPSPASRSDVALFYSGLVALAALMTFGGLTVMTVVPMIVPGHSAASITSGSMMPALRIGDVVVSVEHDGTEIAPDTVVVYEDPRDPSNPSLVTHRVVSQNEDGSYVTKGDAAAVTDALVPAENMRGRARWIVPFVGLPRVWAAQGQWPQLVLTVAVDGAGPVVGTVRRRTSIRPLAHDTTLGGRSSLMRIHARTLLVAALLLFPVALPTAGANFTNPSSNEGSEFTGDILEAPTGLTAACGAANDLEWTATPDTYASGHRTFRSTTSGGPYTQIGEVTPRSTVTYSDGPPTSTYYYVVQAFVGAWESAKSSEVVCCPFPTWWDAAYEHRARFSVSTGSDSVTTGYSVSVAVDHAQLVADGKSLPSGDDLRVLRLEGSDCTWSELDRVLQEGSGWGVVDTTVWFSLQADIAVGSDDADYYLYYDNPVAASPPADKTAVYAVWDDFDDATLGTGWNLDAIGTVAGGTVSRERNRGQDLGDQHR